MAHAAERTLAEQLVQITADTVTLEGNLSLPERRRGRAGAALRLEQYGDQPEIQDEHPRFSTFPSLQGWRSGDRPPCFLVGVSLAGLRSHERCFRQLVAFGGAPRPGTSRVAEGRAAPRQVPAGGTDSGVGGQAVGRGRHSPSGRSRSLSHARQSVSRRLRS